MLESISYANRFMYNTTTYQLIGENNNRREQISLKNRYSCQLKYTIW